MWIYVLHVKSPLACNDFHHHSRPNFCHSSQQLIHPSLPGLSPSYRPLVTFFLSTRSPSLPILSTLGAPQTNTFPVSRSTKPAFCTHPTSFNLRQWTGSHPLPDPFVIVFVLVVEVRGVEADRSTEEPGIPEDKAEGELVWGTCRSLP